MPATSTNQTTTLSAASGGGGGGSRSTRRLKKASTWHPNVNQNASPYSDVYSEARRLKQEQEAYEKEYGKGGIPEILKPQ